MYLDKQSNKIESHYLIDCEQQLKTQGILSRAGYKNGHMKEEQLEQFNCVLKTL